MLQEVTEQETQDIWTQTEKEAHNILQANYNNILRLM